MTDITNLKSDVGWLKVWLKSLAGAAGVVALGLLATGWTWYTTASGDIRQMAVTQERISGKIDTLDAKFSGRFDTLGQRLDDKSQASSRPK